MSIYQWAFYWLGPPGPVVLIVALGLIALMLVWVLAGEINETFEGEDDDN